MASAIGATVALPFNDNLGNTIPPDTPHVSFYRSGVTYQIVHMLNL